MVRFKNLSGDNLRDILEKFGFAEIRRELGHIVMQKQEDGNVITILIPDAPLVARRVMSVIIRQSDLLKHLFD